MKKIVKELTRGGQKLEQLIQEILEKFNLKKKMLILYLGCMLIPLVLTDGWIFAMIVRLEHENTVDQMENITSAVSYAVQKKIDHAEDVSRSIYKNRYINEFLTRQYTSGLEFYNAYLDFMKDTLFESGIGGEQDRIIMYADNETLISGSEFRKLDEVRDSSWYKAFQESGLEVFVYCSYDKESSVEYSPSRKISLIRRLDFYQRDGCEKVLKIDLDYNELQQSLVQMQYENPVYVCADGKILLSNQGNQSRLADFKELSVEKKNAICKNVNFYGQELEILVLNNQQNVLRYIGNNFPMILVILLFNRLIPWILVKNINRSLTERISRLGEVFSRGCESEELSVVEEKQGNDEIAVLIRNYNWMARRQNELLETVYKEKLREQEMDIARQNAELLALHSQINPHFLFNALESIRMHSFLKKEYETAHMVEMLAVMERQYVEWNSDDVTLRQEVGFVQAYLELQKYRFGERLSYQIDLEDVCGQYLVPKLSLVTFAENACVHGIEKKVTPGWIFVRVFQKEAYLCMEIEDTGKGMSETEIEKMRKEVSKINIERMKEIGHIGIMNACLRLKMSTQNQVEFDFESEEEVGMCVTIRVPLDHIRKIERYTRTSDRGKE